MPITQRLFQFQIVTDTSKEAQQFMKEVKDWDISVEEMWYGFINRDNVEYCCGFGVTPYKPKLLKRIADFMDLHLVYSETHKCGAGCGCCS